MIQLPTGFNIKNQKMKTFPSFTSILILLINCMFTYQSIAQENEFICPSDDLRKELLEQDERYASKQAKFEKFYRKEVADYNKNPVAKTNMIYTLPVIFHVIHDGDAPGNNTDELTLEMILTEFDVVNQFFSHTHTGAMTYAPPLDAFYGADTEIEFCLANEDENGNYVEGVMRYHDHENAYNPSKDFMNSIKWDTDKYVNIFIAYDIGGPQGYYSSGNNDFIVIMTNLLNPGILSHELGHYLNLGHIFNDACNNDDCLSNGDFVCDTPPKAESGGSTGGCLNDSCTSDEDDTSTNNPFRPIALGGLGNQNDAHPNWMGYSFSCWDSFTQGQKVRMRADIEANRVDLKNNASVCSALPTNSNDIGITFASAIRDGLCDSSLEIATVSITNYGNNTVTSADIELLLDGTLISTTNWTGNLDSGESTTFVYGQVVNLNVGSNTIELRSDTPNGLSDSNNSNDSKSYVYENLGGNSCDIFSECRVFLNGFFSVTTTTFNIIGDFPTYQVGKAIICVETEFSSTDPNEYFIVYDENGTYVGNTILDGTCNFSTPFCFEASAEEYYQWILNDTITVTIDPAVAGMSSVCEETCVEVLPIIGYCVEDILLDFEPPSGEYLAGDNIECNQILLSSTDSCEYILSLYDSWGDGWNQSYMEVTSNGNFLSPPGGWALTFSSLPNQFGPEHYYFKTAQNETVELLYGDCYLDEEAYWTLIDCNGNLINSGVGSDYDDGTCGNGTQLVTTFNAYDVNQTTFNADTIYLLPGFETPTGKIFNAISEGCSN